MTDTQRRRSIGTAVALAACASFSLSACGALLGAGASSDGSAVSSDQGDPGLGQDQADGQAQPDGQDQQEGDRYNEVCVDAAGLRADDRRCGDPNGTGVNGFLWFYILSSLNQPRTGTQVVHAGYYSPRPGVGFTKPAGFPIAVGVPQGGATAPAGAATTPSGIKPANPSPQLQTYSPPKANVPRVYNPPKAANPAPRPPAPRPAPAPRAPGGRGR